MANAYIVLSDGEFVEVPPDMDNHIELVRKLDADRKLGIFDDFNEELLLDPDWDDYDGDEDAYNKADDAAFKQRERMLRHALNKKDLLRVRKWSDEGRFYIMGKPDKVTPELIARAIEHLGVDSNTPFTLDNPEGVQKYAGTVTDYLKFSAAVGTSKFSLI